MLQSNHDDKSKSREVLERLTGFELQQNRYGVGLNGQLVGVPNAIDGSMQVLISNKL
ncbi:hypothetical protein V6Z11_D05G140800 [Gossypium hirsutum]